MGNRTAASWGLPGALAVVMLASACSSVRASIPLPAIFRPEPTGPVRRMVASWYGAELAGRATASGERFDPEGFTCAHRSLPFGTILLVRNPRTGASVRVTVNDRGPFAGGRDLDLSKGAARRLGIVAAGVAEVDVQIVERGGGIVARDHAGPAGTLGER